MDNLGVLARGHRLRRVGIAISLIAATIAPAGASWAASKLVAATCAPFKVVPAPKVVGGRADSISGTSPTDLWTVGLGIFQPTILHWNGTAWTVSPQDGVEGSSTAVAAISPTDAWLVGESPPEGPIPMSKHWDGSIWSSIPVPQIGPSDKLNGIAAVSSTDVWAVGNDDSLHHPLIVHWDGSAWRWIPAPHEVVGSKHELYGISAVSATDIWAVGLTTRGNSTTPLTEHYDGQGWTVVDSPFLSGNENSLVAISARASDDVWAVGREGDSPTGSRTLAEHWDGRAWNVIPTPDVEGITELFAGVDAVSATDVWAVGVWRPGVSDLTLAEHWNGTAWSKVGTPPLENAGIGAILETMPTEVWATGSIYDPSISTWRPLIMRSGGCRSDS